VCTPGDTEPCYSGPASTLGLGACHGGVRACAADGSGFGACAGEVVPQPESCGSAVDVDCNGSVGGCTGAPEWKVPITGNVVMGGVAASADGEAVIFGWAQTIDLGSGPQGDSSTWGLFVAGIAAAGAPRWLHVFPGVDASTRVGAVVMSAAHEATLAVYAEGPVAFGVQAVDATPNGVVALRFDGGGNLLGARLVDLGALPGAPEPWPQVAHIAGDGGVLVGGAGFLGELGDGLSTTWNRRYTAVTFAGLTVDAAGSLFAAGSYQGSFEPGGGATPVAKNHAGFVAELHGGDVLWSQTLGGDVETTATSVVALPSGVLTVCGLTTFQGELVGGSTSGPAGTAVFLGERHAAGDVTSGFFGFGPRTPDMTMDASGDVVSRLVGTQWGHFVIKSVAGKSPNDALWLQPFQWKPFSATLPSGETIVATQAGVQKLGR
jgi:hypothetical protein